MAVSRYYSSVARRTTLTADTTAIATTLTVAAATGFPSLYPYTLILDQDTVDEEIVEVTNRSGTTLTVTRGVDGTSATAHTAGASVEHGVSARDFAESRTHEDTDAGVHGVAGDLVGTTDAQVLSNKTLGTDLAAGGFKITGLADPASAQDAATKNWVETAGTSQTASAIFYAAAASVSAADSAASAVAAAASAASALASAAAASVSASLAGSIVSASAVLLSTVDAKGDLVVGTAADTVGRLAAGTDGYVLSASAAAASGLAWHNIDGDLALKLDVSPTQSTQTADYDFALADATGGKLVVADKATAIAFTVLQQSSRAWSTGAVLRWFNKNDGVLTITAGSGVTFIGSSLTYAKGTGGMAVRTASNEWVVLPFSSGSGVGRGTISGTTGSPTTSANGGATAYKWNADGSVTVDTAGLFSAVVVGGGGSGGCGNRGLGAGAGGGAGGVAVLTDIYLAAGTYTVNVGVGGQANTERGWAGYPGEASALGPFVAAGGGGGGGYGTNAQERDGQNGGSGGGAGGGSSTGVGGLGTQGQGNAGGDSTAGTGGAPGGGGANAAAANVGATANGGAGGAGVASTITGSSVTYGGGGGGGSYAGTGGAGGSGGGGAGGSTSSNGADGTANLGGGGGGGAASGASEWAGGAGGSGVVILLVGTV